MRQTSPTATEPHGKRADALGAGAHHRLRDVDRWKDKIEIRLDNRQVAFLFFGSALIACLLFILGVIVGKRLESRGHALAPEIEDPLALLDRVASAVPASPVARTLGRVAISRAHAAAPAPHPAAAPVAVAPETEELPAVKPHVEARKPESRAEVKAVVQAEVKAPAKIEARAQAKAALVEPEALPQAPVAAPSKPRLAPIAAAPVSPAARPLPALVIPPPTRPGPANPELLPPTGAAGGAATKPTAEAGRTRFMLQVGSFQDRAEAEAFAGSFAGERPQIITSELPGKGTWYRVRVGGWAAFQEAVAAKLSFEKRYSKIALVVGPM